MSYELLEKQLTTYNGLTTTTTGYEYHGDVVISGLSGRLPNGQNVYEWSKHLQLGTPFKTPSIWCNYENDDEKYNYDWSKFGGYPTDPFMVKLYQVVWEALVDAGLKPYELKYKRVGLVFAIGKFSENFDSKCNPNYSVYDMTTMPIDKYAGELVKYFELVGPVQVFDSTEVTTPQCFVALDYGYDAIRSDACDIVIVAGVSNYYGNAYGKVDGVFIVEKKPIEPIKYYAKILDSKVKFDILRNTMPQETKEFDDSIGYGKFLHDFYTYGHTDADQVEYLETNWSWPATQREPCWQPDYYAIGDAFSKIRTTKTPFKMGTTKWMNGDYTTGNGVYSLFKILMSMKMGVIPSHAQYKLFVKPKNLKGGYEVNEEEYFDKNNQQGLYAFSSFGRTLVHVVFEPFKCDDYSGPTPTPTGEYEDLYAGHADDEYDYDSQYKPKLITVSGPTKKYIEDWFECFRALNGEYDHTENTKQHPFRGYAIYDEGTRHKKIEITKTPLNTEKRPIWFAFTGMPTHWHGKIGEMMDIPSFAMSINKSAQFLKQHYEVDVLKWISSSEDIEIMSEKDKLFYTYIIVPLMQIAFVQMFQHFGIYPDYTVGYACGEIVAAYAKNIIKYEDAIKAIYWKSKILYDEFETYTKLKWKTAIVGLSYKKFMKYVGDKYPMVYITHYNTTDSITIGGHEEQFKKLIKELHFNGVYVKELQTNGVPMNSHYMEGKYDVYKKKLDEFMGGYPFDAYKSWYPTTASMKKHGDDGGFKTLAEYFASNMYKQVYFNDVLDKIHDHSIVIEIGPTFEHLKQFFKDKSDWIKYYSLMKMDEHNGYFDLVLNNLGKLYNEGVEIDWKKVWSYKPRYNSHTQSYRRFGEPVNQPKYVYPFNRKDEKDSKWIKYYETFGKHTAAYEPNMPVGMDGKTFMLESVKFVPYNEQRVYDYGDSESEKLKKAYHEHFGEYVEEIKQYLGKLIAEKNYKYDTKRTSQQPGMFTTPEYDEYESFFGKKKYDGKFLDYLKSLFECPMPFADEKFDKLAFYKYWNEDKYLNFYRNMYLKSIMDTVYENLDDQKTFKVLEIAPMMNCFGKKLYEQSKYPSKFEYYYAPIGKYFDTKLLNDMKKDVDYPMVLINDWSYEGDKIQFPMHKYKDFDLIIFNGGFSMFNDTKMIGKWLHEIKDQMLKPSGFILAHEYKSDFAKYFKHLFYGMPTTQYSYYGHDETDEEWKKIFDSDYFHEISYKVDPKLSKFYLYRKPFTCALYNGPKSVHTKNDWQIYLTDDDHDDDMQKWYGKIKYALNESKYDRVWLISEKYNANGVMGLVKHIRDYEPYGKRLRCVFINGQAAKDLWSHGYDDIKRGDLVWNVYDDKFYGSYKHFPYEISDYEQSVLKNGFDIQKLEYLKQWPAKSWTSVKNEFKDVKDLVQVSYASLNPYWFDEYDQQRGSKYDATYTNTIGLEFAGLLHKADGGLKRVVGIKPVKYVTTGLDVDKKYLWELPEKWSFEDAATVPYSYATAYYGLCKVGMLKKYDKLVIMDGATPIGQAAISIALRKECLFYVLVRNESEAYYLANQYPKLIVGENVFYTKQSLYGKIMNKTSNGIDMVFSKAIDYDSFPSKSYVYWTKQNLTPQAMYNKNVFYANISDLFDIEEYDAKKNFKLSAWEQIYEWIKYGLESDYIKPLKFIVHDKYEFAEQYGAIMERYAQFPIEKMLVRICDPEFVIDKPVTYFNQDETYVFINGTTTKFSLYLAQWLSKHGARKFLFTYPVGKPKFSMSKDEIEQLESFYGVTVKFVPYDPKNYEEILMKSANPFATKIAGLFYFFDKYDANSQMSYKLWLEKHYMDIDNLYTYAFEKCIAKHMVIFTPFHAYGHYLKPLTGSHDLYYTKDNFYSTYKTCSNIEKLIYKLNETVKVVQASFVYDWLNNGSYTKKQYADDGDKWDKVFEFLEHVLFKQHISTIWSMNWTCGDYAVDSFKKGDEYKNKLFYEDELKSTAYPGASTYSYKSYEEQKKSCAQIKYREYGYGLKQSQSKYGLYDGEAPFAPYETMKPQAKYNYLMPKNVIEKLNDVESKYLTPVFIIHPIEGHAGVLKTFAQYVKYPVFGVQFTEKAIGYDSIESLADYYTKCIMTELKKLELVAARIHLCGYGYGAQIAFQMTRNRVDSKFLQITSLSLLDGSFKYPSKYDCPIGEQKKTEYVIEWLKDFYKQYAPEFYMPDTMTLKRLSNDEERYDYIVTAILDNASARFNFEPKDLKLAAKAYVKKMLMSCFYLPHDGLKFDKVLLVKPEYKKEKFDESLWFLPPQNRDKYEWKTVQCYDREFLDSTNGQAVAQYLNEFFKLFW